MFPMKNSLDLALIGNGTIGLLIDPVATVVWGCFPRFDSDPTFCALLDTAPPAEARGIFAIELTDLAHSEQHYVRNTAVLSTRLVDRDGGEVEIIDCAPRHREFDRMHTPHALVRHVRRVAGRPRITVRLRPAGEWGSLRPETTAGSHHIRYVTPKLTLRVTTDASLTSVADERTFFVELRTDGEQGGNTLSVEERPLVVHEVEATVAPDARELELDRVDGGETQRLDGCDREPDDPRDGYSTSTWMRFFASFRNPPSR